jgi:hypothetical protein
MAIGNASYFLDSPLCFNLSKTATAIMGKNALPSIAINDVLAGDWLQTHTLLKQCYKADDHPGKAIDQDQLINLLQSINVQQEKLIDAVTKQLDESELIGANNYAIIKFADQLIDNYIINNKLHPDIKIHLAPLKTMTAIELLSENFIWKKPEIVKLLSLINESSLGWQHDLGRAGDKHLAKIIEILSSLASNNTDSAISNCSKQLSAYIDKEQLRIKKVEQRLSDAQIGALHTKHAMQLSAKSLNQKMVGKKLPAVISRFLQGPWRESMRLIIIHHGEDSEQWRKILLLTETLVWSVQPESENSDDNKKHQLVLESISELSEQLREITIGLHHSNKLDQELAEVESQHLKILKGERLQYHDFNLIDNTNPLVNSQVSISSTLIEKASSFDTGQWFIDTSNSEEKRIKLCLNITQAKQLLFTNFLGIKTAQYSFEEFAYLLSSNIIKPLSTKDRLQATAEKILTTLFQSHQQRQVNVKAKLEREQQIAQQQLELRQNARKKALREAKKLAIANKEAQEKIKHKVQQEALFNEVEKLQLGAKVEFIEDGHQHICKVAAILQPDEQYIFVDRSGIKRHTINKQQLVNKLLECTANIIDYGSSFDSTLEKVVNNLRARRKP